MTSVVEIRDAEPADVARLGDVYRRSSLSHADQRELLLAHPEVLELDGAAVLAGGTRVAVLDGDVAGFATVADGADGAVELVDLFVDPDRMRGGVGRTLVEDLAQRARARGATRIDVTANEQALAFYESVGFVRTGTAPTRFGPAPRMQRQL